LQTGILAAGPEGIDSKRDPGLLDGLRRIEKSAELKHYFGQSFINSYISMKNTEWNSYTRHLTEWERQNMLDC
jgi:glutamine synthetase